MSGSESLPGPDQNSAVNHRLHQALFINYLKVDMDLSSKEILISLEGKQSMPTFSDVLTNSYLTFFIGQLRSCPVFINKCVCQPTRSVSLQFSIGSLAFPALTECYYDCGL